MRRPVVWWILGGPVLVQVVIAVVNDSGLAAISEGHLLTTRRAPG